MATLNELALARELEMAGTSGALVSLFPHGRSVTPDKALSLAALVAGIRAGEWKDEVEHIRALAARGEQTMVGELKRRLPAATLSCTMYSRSRGAERRTRTHSGWVQLDFDGKENAGMDQAEARAKLMADPHVGAVFVGPSGLGIKGVVRVDPTRHLDSARSARAYFAEQYGLNLDAHCTDVERMCFVSYDPEAWLRPDTATVLPITDPGAPQPLRHQDAVDAQLPLGVLANAEWTAEDIREMLQHVGKRPDYLRWLKIASAVFSVLPFEVGAQVLNEWSPEESPGEYHEKWRNRLKDVTLGTLVHYALEGGFDAGAAARRRRWAGQIFIGGQNVTGARRGDPAPHANLLEPERAEAGIPMDEIWGALEAEQYGDAAMFWRQEGANYLYDPGEDTWRSWDPVAARWCVTEQGAVRLKIMWTSVATYQSLIDSNLESMSAKPAAKNDPRKEENDRLKDRISNLRKTSYLNAVLTMVGSHPRLVRPANRFDEQRHLLGLQGGMVYDFHSCVIRPAVKEDYLTITAPVAQVDGAECPFFDAFLLRAMGGDQAMVDYLWRAVGMSMTGLVDTSVFFFCFGEGANGKSTWLFALSKLLGDEYFATVDTAALMASGGMAGNTVQYAKAQLHGKRIVAAEETQNNSRLNDGLIKTLCSQDKINARHPAGRPFTFSPSHTLWMTGNHKPEVPDQSDGLWRRVQMIPWLHQIPADERLADTVVHARITAELPGLLNRALVGWRDYIDRGRRLDPPQTVIDAVNEYRADEDSLGRFIADRTTPTEGAMIALSELYREYAAWCEAGGGRRAVRNHRDLAAQLRSRRFGFVVANAREKWSAHVHDLAWN